MKKFVLVGMLLLTNTGCIGNLASVHHNLEVSNGKGALIDIKQRGILSVRVPVYDEAGRRIGTETRVCAEASPDSLSAYAAELAAKADTGKIGAQIAAALQEGSSFVGMRTPTIQSLRDASYRLCESYLNGAISGAEYGWQLRRFQRNMVVLAAVEQLTGAMSRVPPVTIKMQGQADVPKSPPSEITAGGSSTASVESLNIPQSSPQYIASVSADVAEMVSKILNQDDRGQLCFIYLSSLTKDTDKPAKPISEKLEDICVDFLSNPDAGVKRHKSTESVSDILPPEGIPDTTKKLQKAKNLEKK